MHEQYVFHTKDTSANYPNNTAIAPQYEMTGLVIRSGVEDVDLNPG
jgi:hypothetical protein